ncbi:MAG: preprotein translocase subunit SecG [Clostridia bacterium]|nr:preprotein translocase subunit SecG [Clostridia bacterium]
MKIFLTILQIIASIGIIATVLLQSGKSAGLSGAIAGGAETIFGKKKGMDNLLSKLSTIFAIAFMILTFIVAIFF